MDEKYNRARNLRKDITPQEQKMWNLLRNRQFYNLKFVRQYPIGSYIVDFVCRKEKLVVEIDGGQHNEADSMEYDRKRTQYLISKGYKIIRFWNNDVDKNLEGVYLRLKEFVEGNIHTSS